MRSRGSAFYRKLQRKGYVKASIIFAEVLLRRVGVVWWGRVFAPVCSSRFTARSAVGFGPLTSVDRILREAALLRYNIVDYEV